MTMVVSCVLRTVSRSARSRVGAYCCTRAYSSEYKSEGKFKVCKKYNNNTVIINPPSKQNRFYTKKHEWVSVQDNVGTVGISSFAQDALGEVVFAQLPDVGTQLAAGDECGALESVKAAGEVYTPISGTVTEKNGAVETSPSLINKSCYEQGWLFRVKLASPEEIHCLMDQTAYDKFLEDSH